jgi:RNA polymerase sigma factor (TIGR02999 family)
MARDVTDLLIDWNGGDAAALDELTLAVYDELRRLARRHMRGERPDHTLDPTALVHEVFLRLVDQNRVEWRNRAHFFAIAARLMRRVLLKHAGRRNAAKRGGGAVKVPLDESVLAGRERGVSALALEEALCRLEEIDSRQARIVELRFCGLTVEEAAETLELSPSTIHRDWRLAKAWLTRELRPVGD